MNNHIYYQKPLAKKRFSQNFLHNNYYIDKIVKFIHPESNQAMVEIGPGLGAITKPIVMHTHRVTVIEIDHDLVTYLNNHPFFRSRLNIIDQDVMKVNFAKLAIKLNQPLRLFGNLPYNISTSLIFHLFNYTNVISDMHFMLQKEVVDRLISIPNNKDYGRLSIMAQYFCKITKLLEIPPNSFQPKPKVYSSLIRMVPHIKSPFPVHNLKNLSILTSLAFNKRRKMLHNSLSSIFNVKQLAELGINSTLRAENISVENYCYLANALSICSNN